MTDQSTADAKKIAYKTELLLKIGLVAGLATAFGPRIHMIKAAKESGRLHRIMCADGSWAEIDPETRRVVRTWGPGRTAREMASAIAGDGSGVEHLEEEVGAASAPGAPIRSTPVLSDEQTKSRADGWRQRGYTDLIEDERGVWVALADGTRLFDTGRRVHIHGPRTDAALAAIAEKARDDWNGALVLRGPGRDWPERDKARLWLACQRQGVEYAGYEPSPKLLAKWEAEKARGAGAASRPDDSALASASPVPPAAGNGTNEPEPKAPAEPANQGADAVLVAKAKRIRANLDALYGRWQSESRTAEDRERLQAEEDRLEYARQVIERARLIAAQRDLDANAAIAAARSELLADGEFEPVPVAGPRR